MMMHPNRESWLLDATKQLTDGLFKHHAESVPPVRISVGFSIGGKARKAIGSCWDPKAADDGISQIYISPVLNDSIQVLETLVHELIHAILPNDGHRAPFKRIALKVGLTGKMTATV